MWVHVCFWLICASVEFINFSLCACVCLFLCVCLVFFQSQQPLEDLDAQLRRALSPETVPVSTHTQVNTHAFGYYSVNLVVFHCYFTVLFSPHANPGLSQWHSFSGTQYVYQ